jgi:virulence-associated protein VapD
MSQFQKLLLILLSGQSDNNIAFSELTKLLERFGFESRIKGSHHIFTKIGVDEILNLQTRGALAKPYQVKQVRDVLIKYRLISEGDNDE